MSVSDGEMTREEELAETIGERVPQAGSGEIADIADLLGEMEGSNPGAEARVYRTVKGKRNSEFLFAFIVGEKTYTELMTELRDRWGGGDFRLDVRSLTGRKNWLARQTFSVVERPPVEPDKAQPLMEMMTRMLEASEARTREMFARMEEREREAREARPEPVDNLAQLEKLATIMRALQPAPAPERSEASSIMEAMTLYDQIRERAREDVEGPKKPWYADAATAAIPLIAGALPGIAQPGALTTTAPGATMPAAIHGDITPMPAWSLLANAPAQVLLPMIRSQLPRVGVYIASIESQAEAGVPAQELAEQILSAIPDSVSDAALEKFLKRGDLLDMWMELVPPARERREYYAHVIQALRSDEEHDPSHDS